MKLNKMKTKSLAFDEDLMENIRLGLPVEVYCPVKKRTLAFGRIKSFSKVHVTISGTCFNRPKYLFFGYSPSLRHDKVL
ncbi:hypothetical protein [Salsuginibacillus kocurii]|uniref:hypothetical protein n=1 Tax=Salsuginibacillus kocurii TaxID=427078 RepID=UPI0003600945|nr:hypothetical protein [Salsuginibacillus kocurii]